MLLPDIREPETVPFVTDEWGFFGIRLESIGGYGAHIAGRILAEAGILYQGLNGSNFSSYGSEKKGTPVKAFVRFTAPDREVRTSAPVDEPQVIGVFHEALVHSLPVTAGLRSSGVVVLNTSKTPATARQLLQLNAGVVATIDAIDIALAEKSRPNMVMLGALCRFLPFLHRDAVKEVIERTFGRKHPRTVPSNLRTFDRGYTEVLISEATAQPSVRPVVQRPRPATGYLNAPIGGVILNPGNSVVKDLSASRQGHLPEFRRADCIDCAQCDMVCPDMCFVWTPGSDQKGKPALVLQGIDYQYCKGCLKCVEACPTDALQVRREEEGWAAAHRVRHPLSLPA